MDAASTVLQFAVAAAVLVVEVEQATAKRDAEPVAAEADLSVGGDVLAAGIAVMKVHERTQALKGSPQRKHTRRHKRKP